MEVIMGKLIKMKRKKIEEVCNMEGEINMKKENFKPIMGTPALSGRDVQNIKKSLEMTASKAVLAKSKKRLQILGKFL